MNSTVSVGINVTVSVGEADDTLVVGWRCGKLAGGGAWHVSANEELVPSDLNGGGPTLVRAVGRALEEELGLQIPTCWEGALGVLSTQLSRSAA